MGIDLFTALVRFYVSRSVPTALKNFDNGRVLNVDGEPHEEGEENKYIHGVVIFADGNTLARRLVHDRVIKDTAAPLFTPVRNYDELESYLRGQHKHDGAFFYNGSTLEMARANRVNDEPDGSAEVARRYSEIAPLWHELVPVDFVSEKATQFNFSDLENTVGRRTGLALTLPYVYSTEESSVHAAQIKQSARGELGMGTVNLYTPQGLSKRFLLRYEPLSCGPFIDESCGITGYVQELRPRGGRVQVVEEERVSSEFYLGDN